MGEMTPTAETCFSSKRRHFETLLIGPPAGVDYLPELTKNPLRITTKQQKAISKYKINSSSRTCKNDLRKLSRLEFSVVINHGEIAIRKAHVTYNSVYEMKDAVYSKVSILIF